MRSLTNNLVSFQSPHGYWTFGNDEPDLHVFYSAGIAHSLAVFGDLSADVNREALGRSLIWLEEVQRPDGSWPIRASHVNSDILTTALVSELLRRAGHKLPFERAASFLLEQQHPTGLWSSARDESDAPSAIAVEVLDATLSSFPPFDHRLSLARGLVAKADDLARAADEVSDQIALITAHQAVEMLLYSALETLDPPINIWQEKGQRTIGLREALARLDQRMTENEGGALKLKSQMQMLASARDGVVHKGLPVARSAVRNCLNDTRKFVSAVSIRVLGYDLLG